MTTGAGESPEHAAVERIVPGSDSFVWQSGAHLARYKFALPRVANRRVLDVATGSGYGAALLAQAASNVVGLDYCVEALEFAQRYVAASNVGFVGADAHSLPFRQSTFDTIVSFETIEHVVDPPRFVAEVARVLRSEGELIASVPADPCEKERNRYHLHSFTPRDLASLLAREFGQVRILSQVRVGLSLLAPARLLRGLARASGRGTRFLAPGPREFRILDIPPSADSESLIAIARRA